MLKHPTLDKLHALKLTGMAAALEDQSATPDITDEGDQTDLSRKTFADFGVEPEICEALDAKGWRVVAG